MTERDVAVRLGEFLRNLRALGVVVNEEFALELISVGEVVVALEVIRDTLPHSLESFPHCNLEFHALARDLGISPERFRPSTGTP